MAKRKRSTALFEVISKSRQYRPARPATSRSGNWLTHAATWFVRPKFRPIIPTGQIGPIHREVVAAQEMEYDEPQVTLSDSADDDDTHLQAPLAVAASATAPEPAVLEPVKYEAPPSATHRDLPVPAATDSSAESEPANVHVAVDTDRRQIALKMSYTAAAVIGLGLVAVVCGAVIAGQYLSHGTLPMLAQTSTEELRKGPAHREVLDPPRRAASPARTASGETKSPAAPRATNHEADARAAAAAQSAPPAVAAAPADGEKRTAGFNYVVVQSYPVEEEEMAQKTAAFLNGRGVNCTVERNVKGFLAVSVVGLEGFTKISSAEYKSYVEHLKKLGAEFTSNSRSFKAFDPRAKKW